MREQERLLQDINDMHLQWFAEPSGDSGGDGGDATDTQPETGDVGAAKPEQSVGQDGKGAEPQSQASSTSEKVELPPWSEQLEKGYRNDPDVQAKIKEIKNTNDLFKRYLEGLEKAVKTEGQEPKDASTTDSVPLKPEEYKLQRPEKLPGDIEYKDQDEQWFRAAAAEAGLSQQQAEAVFGKYNETISANMETLIEANTKSVEKGMEAIKAEYGDDFQEALGNASVIAESIGGAEFMDWLENATLDGVKAANHPAFVLGMMRLGERIKARIGEDVFEGSTSRGQPSRRRPGTLRFSNTPGMEA